MWTRISDGRQANFSGIRQQYIHLQQYVLLLKLIKHFQTIIWTREKWSVTLTHLQKPKEKGRKPPSLPSSSLCLSWEASWRRLSSNFKFQMESIVLIKIWRILKGLHCHMTDRRMTNVEQLPAYFKTAEKTRFQMFKTVIETLFTTFVTKKIIPVVYLARFRQLS